MSTYTPTNRSNPCPICEKTNGNCRTFEDGENILCMTFTDQFAQVPNFKFIGLTDDRLWGKWVPDDNRTLTQAEREQRRQELSRRRQERIDAENQRRAEALPAVERDRLYRQLLAQLPLHPADREDLHRRGLTDEQIEAVGYKSVEQWQKLEHELPHTLPGVSLDGRSLITPRPGYLCPIRDVDNFIVGFQLRSRTSDGPRYSWFTGKTKKRPNGPTPHTPIGELPLSVVKPERIERKAIALVEGLGAKPVVLAQRFGLLTIGAAGGMFAASAETLKLTLDQLGIKNIEFYPDAGAVQNQSVLRQYRATFKLLKEWGYNVRIAWWGQDDKRVHRDIDELKDLSEIQFLSVAEFEAICAQFNQLLHTLHNLLSKFTRPLAPIKGFGDSNENQNTEVKQKPKVDPSKKERTDADHENGDQFSPVCRRQRRFIKRLRLHQRSAQRRHRTALLRLESYRTRLSRTSRRKHHNPNGSKPNRSGSRRDYSLTAPLVLEYEKGDRLKTWQDASAKRGFKYVLDVSSPGTGKSHDSGRVTPEDFEVQQVIYLSDQHRNPTVETLSNGWSDLEARHGGLTRVTTNGGSRLQRSVAGDIPSVTANCSRNKVLNTLRDKHVSGADTASLICGTCILREPCINSDGPGYGYLNQRRNTLGSPLLRAHPDSLPDPEDFPLDDVVLIWDEPSQNFQVKNSITVTFADLQQTIAALMPFPELFCAVQPLLTALLPLLDGSVNLGRHGMGHLEVAGRLPSVSNVAVGAITQVLAPHLGFLNTTSDYGVHLADLPRELRKKFSEHDGAIASQAREQVVKQWLAPLLRVLQGSAGCVQVTRRGLTLSVPAVRHRTMAAAARGNVFLDGTLTREDLALKLGCLPEDICVVRQKIPATPNLEVIQVGDVGRLGMQRGGDQIKRTGALSRFFREDDESSRTLDFKNQNADGAWWRDSRGVNDFLSVKTLVLIGTPCRNLFDLVAEFAIVCGRFASDDDPEFKAFIHRSVLSEIHQAIGRLRAHRRLDEALRVVLVSNIEMDIPVVQKNARDISIEAAGKRERVQLVIQNAIEGLLSKGEKVTQNLVAAMTGVPRGTIARYWWLFISLLEGLNSKVNNFENVSEVDSESNQAISGVLNEMADLPVDELLPSLEEVFFRWVKKDDWAAVWDGVSAGAQMAILQGLALVLPEKALVGVR